jgi:hypothetical protein
MSPVVESLCSKHEFNPQYCQKQVIAQKVNLNVYKFKDISQEGFLIETREFNSIINRRNSITE